MKQHSPLIILLFLLLSAVLYAALLRPQFVVLQGRYEHLQTLTAIISQGEELQKQRDLLQAERNAVATWKRDLLENSKRPYTSEEVVQFVISLNSILLRSSLGAQTYSVGSPQNDGVGTIIVPITFNFSTIEYDLLKQFLLQLSQWDRGARIQSLRISAPQTGAGSDTALQATLVVEGLFSDI